MKSLTLLFTVITTIMTAHSPLILYDFKNGGDPRDWTIINDGVMGGRSTSRITVNEEGNGEFCGRISLENRGGFASVRLRFAPVAVSRYKAFCLRVKGTPGRYQLRCRSCVEEPQSYVQYFEADGSWQEIRVPFRVMYPAFRGRKLDMPDYPGETLAEVGILMGNKMAEEFCIAIEKIWLEE